MIRRLLLILLVSVTGVLGLSRPALAHNTLLSSDPATGTTVESAPTALTLVFDKSVPLDTLSIEIIDATGVRSDLTGSYYGPSGDVQVITPLPALSAGDVNLRWRLVGPDGHPITGRIMFTIALSVVTSTTIAIAGAPLTSSAIAVPAAVGDAVSSTTTSLAPVGAASPADSQSFSQPWTTPDSARWIMRMISYLAIVTIGGIVATLFFVWAGAWRHRLIQRAMAVSIGTAFVAAFAQLATVASDVTGLAPWASLGSMSRALETDAGVALLARMFLLGLLGWIIYSRNRSVLELRWNGAAVVVVLLLGTWAYAGHSRSMRWSVIGIPVESRTRQPRWHGLVGSQSWVSSRRIGRNAMNSSTSSSGSGDSLRSAFL